MRCCEGNHGRHRPQPKEAPLRCNSRMKPPSSFLQIEVVTAYLITIRRTLDEREREDHVRLERLTRDRR
jgi:hypothetical protein